MGSDTTEKGEGETDMRVCPKCGYKEFIWRHLQHGRFTDYCHISELELDSPLLANILKKTPVFYTDGLYNYQLLKSGFVHRIWKDDAETLFTIKEPDMEKPKNRLDIATLHYKVFPPQSRFVEDLRAEVIGKETELNILFGERWKHWIRRDKSGFYYPTYEDWVVLKEKFGITISASFVTSNQTRLLEAEKEKQA
jgi:hypothetical protein